MSKAKLVIDGEEYIFGEKYFMLNSKGEWVEKKLVGYDFYDDVPFYDKCKWYSQISKTDPTDKRNLLKGYGVVCVNKEQADIMQEFVGDLFTKNDNWYGKHNTMKFNSINKKFRFCKERSVYNSPKGNITFEQACELCGIEIPKPQVTFEKDEKVILENCNGDKYKRYYSHFENGTHYIFPHGTSSWNDEAPLAWNGEIRKPTKEELEGKS